MSFEGPARQGLFKTNWFGVTSSCCCFVFLSFVTVEHFTVGNDFTSNFSKLLDVASNIALTIELFSYIFLLFYQICNRKKVLRFLKLIEDIDDEVRIRNS